MTIANDAPSDTNPGTTQSTTKLATDVNADDNRLNAPPTTVDITLATPDNIDTRGLITDMSPLNIGTSTFKVNFANALNAVIRVSNAPVFINASVNEFPVSAICCLNLAIFSTSPAALLVLSCSAAACANAPLVRLAASAIPIVSLSN